MKVAGPEVCIAVWVYPSKQVIEEEEEFEACVVEIGLWKILLDIRCIKFSAEDLIFIDAYLLG